MRLKKSTGWIVGGWMACVLLGFYAQIVVSKSVQCDETEYLKGSRCCKKCEPGFRVFSDCSESHQTKCLKCNSREYQPGWTDETLCFRQKICDPGKGFMPGPENPIAEEPCRCLPGFQCYPINCEYCERIPTCKAGYGLEVDLESAHGRKICVECKKGFYSAENSAEQCQPWTSCKAQGRRETQPGSAHSDAVCGPPISAAPSWVIVSVLSVITVLCLLILLLFCYKDKLKLLSVNLRSCVQNLKRTRIQQETLAPLYHSGAGGGIAASPGGPKCTPCEMTKLICQAPHSTADEPLCTFPTSVPEVKVSLPPTEEETKKKTMMEGRSEGSGEPEEVSEEEEEAGSVSPLLAGSCICIIPVREPLEVGENEDCSQAVSSGTVGTCSCGGLDGDEKQREEKGGVIMTENGEEKTNLSKIDTSVVSLVSLSSPLLHTSSISPPSSPLPELCLPLSQAAVKPDFKPQRSVGSGVKQEDVYVLKSTDSADNSTTSTTSSAGPLMTSSSVGDLYLGKQAKVSSPEQSPALSWEDGTGNKLSSLESGLDCSPESLHSQLAEPTLTSGQVSGNHNTTFISSGQVMNFSGDVIVVYVSQTSLGSDGTEQDDAFGSPVQEEANETAPLFQSGLRSPGDSYSQRTLQEETLPVQEVMVERQLGK
ncbi:tumor necrosis factor receptor superfamily member 11A isoform X2 [Cheilinus undulatus]|uniref:tumor necrosis factor receptor superfamily member 11A isoform X2 n=1 Tax=Cheilinus undulatus TaxID=241271 RepID=UPI001BD20E9A|nr:tumor necrosis factor receptor superfamily member 11A isoform X2 [Cheilinus undulatus]